MRSEKEWSEIASFAKRYLNAFSADDGTLLAIATMGELDAETIGGRIARLTERLGLDPSAIADVEVSDEPSPGAWKCRLPAAERVLDIASISQRSPSALRSLLHNEPVESVS